MASTAPQDNGGSLRKSIGLIELFTFWTCEPIRPAQAFQIGSAGGIIGKNPLKIGKRCWKAAGVHSGKLSPIHRIGNKPDRQGMNQGGVHEHDRHKPERKTPGKSSARRIRKVIWPLDAGIAWRNGKNRHSPDNCDGWAFLASLKCRAHFGRMSGGAIPRRAPKKVVVRRNQPMISWARPKLRFATSVAARSDRRLCRRRQSRSVHRRLGRRARSRGGRVQARHAEGDGPPGYAPGDLLKLYIYRYLNRVRSSRRLEAECHRNIEVIPSLADYDR